MLQRFYSFLVLFCTVLFLPAQSSNQSSRGKIPLKKVIDFGREAPDYDAGVQLVEAAPKPAGDYELRKRVVDSIRMAEGIKKAPPRFKAAAQAPDLVTEFNGNISGGTPNDNDLCIGNNGFIISVVNSSLFVYDTAGKLKKTGSLGFFAKELGTLDRDFDPRVLYDPNHDRFIAVFLNGTSSTTNTPIIGFTQSNDPTGAWNFYQIPGNPLNDTSWSDYPIISITEKDLFLTLNLLYDDKGWKDGFRQSIIWQIDLEDGYAGDSIDHILWTDIKYDGRPVWNICPSQGGMKPEGVQNFFLSVRPGDLSNDSLFLHTITNSTASGQAQLNTKFVRCSQPYGLPPSAKQPDGQYLETNDARVLTAIHQNGLIHFAGNTRDHQSNAAGFYYGILDPQQEVASLQIISYADMDLGYPDIAYAGSGAGDDHSVIITVSHVSETVPPGTSVIVIDYSGVPSPLTLVRAGIKSINELNDTFERWGDYTGIQRRYNADNSYWMAGTYGDGINRTTIACVARTELNLSLPSHSDPGVQVYPNPGNEYLNVAFELPQSRYLRFRIVDLQGREIEVLKTQEAKAGKNVFRFSTAPLEPGTYILLIESEGGVLKSERFVVSR